MTLNVAPFGNMKFEGDAGGGMVYYSSTCAIYGAHLHIMSDEYKVNETNHWYECVSNDGFVFDRTIERHFFKYENYTCRYCGYVVPEGYTTKIVSHTEGPVKVNCGETAEFTVEATGKNLRYTWRVDDGAIINDGKNVWDTGAIM